MPFPKALALTLKVSFILPHFGIARSEQHVVEKTLVLLIKIPTNKAKKLNIIHSKMYVNTYMKELRGRRGQ